MRFKITGSETRSPEELASAILTIVQNLDESEDAAPYVEPIIKVTNRALKDTDEHPWTSD